VNEEPAGQIKVNHGTLGKSMCRHGGYGGGGGVVVVVSIWGVWGMSQLGVTILDVLNTATV
jgi:hypothetical protein